MTPVVNTVNTTTHQLVPASAYMPAALWSAFNVLHNVHRTWRWYRWGKVYTNPDNFFKLSTGHVLNYAIGENLFIRMASQCVLISTRIVDCVDHQVALSKAYQKWTDTLHNRFPHPIDVHWGHDAPGSFKGASIYLRRTANRTYKLAAHMFKLSMTMMDAVEAFSLSPATRNEAVSEVFVNGTQFLDKLSENKEALIEKLKTNKPIIEKVMGGIGAQYHTDQFIDRISKTLTKVNNVNQTIKKIDQATNDIFKDFLKQGIFGFMSALGLAQYCPDSWVPPPEKSVSDKAVGKKYGRYAPMHWMMRLNKLPSVPTKQIQEKMDHPTEWEKQITPNKPIRYIKKSNGPPESSIPHPIAKPPLPVRFKPLTVDEALKKAQLEQGNRYF